MEVKAAYLTALVAFALNAQTGLYTPTQAYSVGILDGYIVHDTPHNRDIPILIRYPIGASGALPMILWSHGGGPGANGKNRADNWGDLLASAGYVVIHMSHLPRDQQQLSSLYTEFGVPASDMPDAFGHLEVDRPRDANAVLADLDNIERAFAAPGKINRQAIAVAGHSFGSYTAMTLAGGRVNLAKAPGHTDDSFANPLPKAFMALSPQGPGRFGWKEDSYRLITRPVLFQSGLNDTTDGEQAPSRVRAHTLLAPGENYLQFINSVSARHETFNLDATDHPEFKQWIGSTGVAWFDAQLKGLATARSYLTSGRTETVSNNEAVIDQRSAAPGSTSVSAASYLPAYFAQDAILSAYGTGLATTTASSLSGAPPTTLGGISLRVTDSNGTQRLAPMFFASPGQVNFLLPSGTATGLVTIQVQAGGVTRTTERGFVFPVNPAIFSADGSGQGWAAAATVRVAADGSQTVQFVARFDGAQNKFVANPIDLGASTDRVYLTLYGTGLRRNRTRNATVGGVPADVLYAGSQNEFPGLDQVNLQLPRSLVGRGDVDVIVSFDDQSTNTVRINIR